MRRAYRRPDIYKRNTWRLDDSSRIYQSAAQLPETRRTPHRARRLRPGLILFGHGSREPLWAEPFERLAARVRARTSAEVRLAYLELIAPDLTTAVGELIATGARSIHIVPIFFGQGGHVRSDLPVLVEDLRRHHPDVKFHCAAAIGEDEAVIEALAGYCLRVLSP
jgi:sirohydrochlorin cobaltochelatase